jgi:hypothetical protein
MAPSLLRPTALHHSPAYLPSLPAQGLRTVLVTDVAKVKSFVAAGFFKDVVGGGWGGSHARHRGEPVTQGRVEGGGHTWWA